MIMLFLKQYWKQASIIALGLIIFSFGWYKGYSFEKSKLDAFKLQIEVNARVQAGKNSVLVQNQEKVTENVTKGYANAIKDLNTYYSTHRVYINTPSSTMSSPTETSITVNGETKSDLSSTIRDCSLDVTQLLYLQQWIKDQEMVDAR